jgi:hypothetical protein
MARAPNRPAPAAGGCVLFTGLAAGEAAYGHSAARARGPGHQGVTPLRLSRITESESLPVSRSAETLNDLKLTGTDAHLNPSCTRLSGPSLRLRVRVPISQYGRQQAASPSPFLSPPDSQPPLQVIISGAHGNKETCSPLPPSPPFLSLPGRCRIPSQAAGQWSTETQLGCGPVGPSRKAGSTACGR